MYAEPDTLELGVTEIQLSNVTVRIFEKERLICECLKYEDKMDRERFKEGLMHKRSEEGYCKTDVLCKRA